MKRALLIFFLIPYIGFCQWTQVGGDVVGEAASDEAGTASSISADGTIIAVGAQKNSSGPGGSQSGHTRIYENLGGVWTQIGSDIDGIASGDAAGTSVSLSADGARVAIGAPGVDGSGTNIGDVKIYDNIGGVWVLDTAISGEAANDGSGNSVSLSANGTVLGIGARLNDGNGTNSGHVRVYEKIGHSWSQIGADIDGDAVDYYFGTSVSLNNDGTVVAIGANGANANGGNSGHVKVFENLGGVWTLRGAQIAGASAGDNAGFSLSLNANGDYVAIGGTLHDGNGTNSGHVRVFNYQANNWVQVGNDIDGDAVNDNFGYSVSINDNGNVIAASSVYNNSFTGHVKIYRNTGNWTQIGSNIAGHTQGAVFGVSVNLNDDGSNIVMGGNLAPGTTDYSGYVSVYTNPVLGISKTSFGDYFEMHPNPTTNAFTIKSLELINQVTIYNVQGKLVRSFEKQFSSTYNVEALNSGLYFVNIKSANGATTKKLIKQ